MSKLAIFLCALVFASVTNARSSSDELEQALKKIDKIISPVIERVNSKSEAAEHEANVFHAQLEALAVKYSQEISDEVSTVLEDARDKVKNTTNKAGDVDVTECTEFVKELNSPALSLSAEIKKCLDGEIEEHTGKIESMKLNTFAFFEKLEALKKEGIACREKVIISAISCAKTVEARAKSTIDEIEETYFNNLHIFKYLYGSLGPSDHSCKSEDPCLPLRYQSWKIIKKTERCVEQKIGQANGDKPLTNDG